MVGPWRHRPGTLRALLTILKGTCYVVCRSCKRYAPLSAEGKELDRPYEPCPFVCSRCGVRAEIVMEAPAGFALTSAAPRGPRRPAMKTEPPAPLGPRHTPSF